MPRAEPLAGCKEIKVGQKVVVPPEHIQMINKMITPLLLSPREGAVLGFGAQLGLTREDGVLKIAEEAQYFCSCINQVTEEALTACALQATWTSLQVNVDTTAELHKDVDCSGTSLILLAGDFCRGAFRCGNLVLDATGQLLALDRRQPHSSDEFSGHRISLVFHTLGAQEDVGEDVLEKLRALNFPISRRGSPGRALPSLPLRFLYLFAGPERRSSIGHFLQMYIDGTIFTEVVAEEVDILRGPSHDLLDAERQVAYVSAVSQGSYHVVMISSACNTWTRALWANCWGPRPIRSQEHPRGFP